MGPTDCRRIFGQGITNVILSKSLPPSDGLKPTSSCTPLVVVRGPSRLAIS